MQSFIIASTDKNAVIKYLEQLYKQHHIHTADITTLSDKTIIGIEEIRALFKKIYLKPIQSPVKAVVISDAQNLTIAAQNALLKILEEPPDNTLILLALPKSDLLLPTITSRCTVIELRSTLDESELPDDVLLIQSFSQNEIGKKLLLAQNMSKNKDDAANWIRHMIVTTRKILIEHVADNNTSYSTSQLLKYLRELQKTHTLIKTTNVNVRLAMENLLLTLQ